MTFSNWAGYREHEKKIEKIMRETKKILQGLIDEHKSGNNRGLLNNNSMIDHLLSLQKTEPEYYTDDIIKGLVLVRKIMGLFGLSSETKCFPCCFTCCSCFQRSENSFQKR